MASRTCGTVSESRCGTVSGSWSGGTAEARFSGFLHPGFDRPPRHTPIPRVTVSSLFIHDDYSLHMPNVSADLPEASTSLRPRMDNNIERGQEDAIKTYDR
jgi:hypothetical protein